MWECSILFQNSQEAENFIKAISPYVKKNSGVVISVYFLSLTKVLLAIPESKHEEAYSYIKEKIAESILLTFKKKYILSRLDFDTNFSTNMMVFIQTLVCFDSDTDKKIICEKISFKNSFCVDSFARFRLGALLEKWNDLILLANENIMYLLSEDSFTEFIKFLISNLDHRCYAVNVFSKNNCYFLCDLEGKRINDFLLDKSIAYDDSKLLTSLIALNPEKIILHANPFIKDKLLKKLYNFFMDRIELSK